MDTTESLNETLSTLSSGFGKNDKKRSVEELLERWKSGLGATVETIERGEQFVRFESSIPTRLRGLDHSIVLVVGEDTVSTRGATGRLLRDTSNGWKRGIVLCLSDSAFRHFRTSPSIPSRRVVCLSRDDVSFILTGEFAIESLRKYMQNQLPFRRLIPFSISEPAVGNMFVGRRNELEMLIYENQDFALCGAGGMGKTSLLRQMQWMLRRERDPRYPRLVEVNLISCEGENIDEAAQVIAKRICSTSFAQDLTVDGLHTFFKRMRTIPPFLDGPIDLVIDEIDSTLSTDRRSGYRLMKALRHARQAGLIRLTVSGRTETKRLLEDHKNPFAVDAVQGLSASPSRLKLIELEPLSKNESQDLLFGPLSELGIDHQFDGFGLDEKLAECAGIPYAIQNLGLDISNALAAQIYEQKLMS